MLELTFFILGVVNSLFLIAIFIIRRSRLDILKRFGWSYLLLAIPALFTLFLALREQNSIQYIVFIGIFLLFLLVEGIYDFVLKLPFREKTNWWLLGPYLALYYAMNYGFIVMPWKTSLAAGVVMICLFVIQLVANLRTHPFQNKNTRTK